MNDVSSIKRLVELVGGTWGAIPLEKKFELVEKALFRGSQKVDESSDSYLSRTDVIWTELLTKGADLKEIQSYIILRGSRLNADDKKRVIVESGAEKGGVLELSKVQAAIRMVGSGFFQEMTGAKRDKSLKTYDHTAFTVDEMGEDDTQETFWVQDELDDQVLETLATEDDEDAALILQFEDAISETIQNDSEMCAFYSSYQEARKRLSEKVRFRGFWAVKRGDKGFGKKGKSKGKGKGSLASRIANSYCRICMRKGHWKNECPSRKMSGNASSAASSHIKAGQTQAKHVPKARLVVLGYEDPLVHEIPRDSPTMSKLSRMLILQTAASQQWEIESFDIRTAFLRGTETTSRTLGREPPNEMREKMKLKLKKCSSS